MFVDHVRVDVNCWQICASQHFRDIKLPTEYRAINKLGCTHARKDWGTSTRVLEPFELCWMDKGMNTTSICHIAFYNTLTSKTRESKEIWSRYRDAQNWRLKVDGRRQIISRKSCLLHNIGKWRNVMPYVAIAPAVTARRINNNWLPRWSQSYCLNFSFSLPLSFLRFSMVAFYLAHFNWLLW